MARFNLWPTPTANGYGNEGSRRILGRRVEDGTINPEEKIHIEAGHGGQLNPSWVEWLMGWPIGWTDLQPLETGRFRQWLEQHGDF
jgi:hypothetical protein